MVVLQQKLEHQKQWLVEIGLNLKIKNKKTKYKGKYLICTPFGEIHIVENLTRYAKQNNLEPSNLNRCANGLIKTTKGYKVKKYQACKDW